MSLYCLSVLKDVAADQDFLCQGFLGHEGDHSNQGIEWANVGWVNRMWEITVVADDPDIAAFEKHLLDILPPGGVIVSWSEASDA